MDFSAKVVDAARELNLLDSSNELKKLTSVQIIDFVVKLEEVSSMDIPTTLMRTDVFESVETVSQMLSELAEDQA